MESKAAMKKMLVWLNRLRFVFAGLAAVGMIGAYMTILPDFEYEMSQVYMFAGIACAGYAGLLFWTVLVFIDWIRDKAHQEDLFIGARKWRPALAWVILVSALGRIFLTAPDWPVDVRVFAGMLKTVAEIGILGEFFCGVVLIAERNMKKREQSKI